MNRARLTVALVAWAAFAVGCRAILGIESLEVTDAGAQADGATPGDATVGDAGGTPLGDAGPPVDSAPPPPDANPCSAMGPDCNRCCRNGSSAELLLEHYAREAGCVCGGGQCTSECATTFCANPPTPPNATACGPCVGLALASDSGACAAAQATCEQDPSCKSVVDCVRQCPSPGP